MKKLNKKFDKMLQKAKQFEKGITLEFKDLFTEKFMSQNTKFNSIEKFFELSPFQFDNQEEFNKIDVEDLNKYVAENTRFSNWEEMKSSAASEYMIKNIFN